MLNWPITLSDISASFPHKVCFEDFSGQIYGQDRIAIIGRNGNGKSTLLKILSQRQAPSSGHITYPEGLNIGYVEQTIDDVPELSGGERFQRKLSEVLSQSPDLLLLDEPTNHLDQKNKQSLLRFLIHYQGACVIVSHDRDLLQKHVHKLWHIDHRAIHEFCGSYDHYIEETRRQKLSIEKDLEFLKKQKKDTHDALMKEQERASKSQSQGRKSIQQKKWPTVVSRTKAARAQQTTGLKKAMIHQKKSDLEDKLSALRLPETIKPQFSLKAEDINDRHILNISHATIGWRNQKPIVRDFSLSLYGRERIAISGPNGSGKSTLLKAILDDQNIVKTGEWQAPHPKNIGFLDQHYANLIPTSSVIQHMHIQCPDCSEKDIRHHLSDFLFRKNEEVMQPISCLSGGEKARLSLSLIAAQTPRLLLLDELTNNLDIETKEHVIQVLQAYPGAIIVISHEDAFLNALKLDQIVGIQQACQKNSSYFTI